MKIRDIIIGAGIRLCVAITLLLMIGHAQATIYNWKAPVSGSFSTPSSWDPAGPPGAADGAVFNLGSAGYSVSIFLANVDTLKIDNDTLTFASGIVRANNPNLPSIALGNNSGDVANLTVNGARITGVNDAIGYAAQTQGTAILNTRAMWSSTNQYIGYAGTGKLALTGASTATAATSETIGSQFGSQGTLTLDGGSNLTVTPPQDNSLALVVGSSGTGTLSVNSGTVTLSDQMIVAQNAMSQGTVTFDSANSTLTTPSSGSLNMSGLTVGMGGNGSLSITNAASATIAGPLMIGQNTGSQGNLSVAGANSLLTPPGFGNAKLTSVTVGASGDGALSVTAGATAKLGGPLVIGQNSGSQGSLSIDGTNSLLTSLGAGGSAINSVAVGVAGQGSFSVTGGGQAQLSTQIVVGIAAGGNGTVTVDGVGSQLVSSGNQSGLTVGNSGTGSLSVTGGGLASISNPIVVGQNAGAEGTVTVDSSNSKLSFAGSTVGATGTGTFAVTNGGLATTAQAVVIGRDQGASGTVTIDGANSKLTNTDASGGGGAFTVGKDGSGQISITHGGALTATLGSMVIGADKGASGSVSVNGAGSNLALHGNVPGNNPTIIVGQNGTGSLSASGGATIDSGPIYVGPSSGSSAGQGTLTLDGAGTSLTIAGASGGPSQINGSVSVTGGASWSTGGVNVATLNGHSSTVTVEGANSNWNASSGIHFGSPGTGSLTISNGGSVSASGSIDFTASTINIQGGTLTGSSIDFNSSTLIDNGTINGNVFVSGGVISGTGNISGELLVVAGTISPGNSPGTLTVGSFESAGSALKFEINSALGTPGGPIGWDLLASQSEVAFPNNLILDVASLTPGNAAGNVSDFNPAQDYHWTFLTAGGGIIGFSPAVVTVETSEFSNPTLGQFSVSEVGNSLVLNYTVPEPGAFVLALLGLSALAAWRWRHPAAKRSTGA